MKKNLIAVLLLFGVGCSIATEAFGDTVTVTWQYNAPTSRSIYASDGITALAGAGTSADGDGFVLQLGYYTGATTSDPFLGTWVPVFGPGTTNSLFSSAGMGDGKGTTGTDDRFVFSNTIDTTVSSTTTGIPSAGQIMSIRYYNASSLGSATFYGAASSDAWTWVSPAAIPPTGMSFNLTAATFFQGGASVPETNFAVIPEPSTFALLGLGASLLFRRIRRRILPL